jgi:hypothetical protein
MLTISNEDLYTSLIALTSKGNTLEHSCEIINVSRGYVYQKLSKEQLKAIKESKIRKPKKQYKHTNYSKEFNGYY